MRLAAALTAALLLSAGLNAVSLRLGPRGWPITYSLAAESAVEDASLFSLGMRRLAADLELVRLLIYYGSDEEGHGGEHAHEHEPFNPRHPERSWGGGSYPQLKSRALRILDKDPSFGYAALYCSGALAFNLNRPQEAIDILRYALSRDPRNREYIAYVGAVGFHRNGDAAGVIRLLEPVLHEPDCPTMIKHMVAYLYIRSGRVAEGRRLYREILETSRDEGYRRMAARALGVEP
jgi:tetratricopeptide (TPR) repeat protein